MTNSTSSIAEQKVRGNLELPSYTPRLQKTPGAIPSFPPVNPPSGSLTINGVPIIPTINGRPQTQQPGPPPNYTWR